MVMAGIDFNILVESSIIFIIWDTTVSVCVCVSFQYYYMVIFTFIQSFFSFHSRFYNFIDWTTSCSVCKFCHHG